MTIAPVPDLKGLRRVRTGWRDFTTGWHELRQSIYPDLELLFGSMPGRAAQCEEIEMTQLSRIVSRRPSVHYLPPARQLQCKAWWMRCLHHTEAGCGKALAKERPAALALRRELGYPLPHPVNHGRRAVLDPKAADRSWSPRTSVSAPRRPFTAIRSDAADAHELRRDPPLHPASVGVNISAHWPDWSTTCRSTSVYFGDALGQHPWDDFCFPEAPRRFRSRR